MVLKDLSYPYHRRPTRAEARLQQQHIPYEHFNTKSCVVHPPTCLITLNFVWMAKRTRSWAMKMAEKEEDETRFERVTYRTAAGCSTPELFVLLLDDDNCGSHHLIGSGGHRMSETASHQTF